MRRVRSAGREVQEERPVRHQRLLLAHPVAGSIGEVLGQVIALLGRRRWLHGRRALVQRGLPLVVLATDEAVEGLEAAATRRPGIERAHRRRLPHRHLVALAELGGRVPVELERHRQRRLGVGAQRAVAGRRRGGLGDAAHAHRMMVPAREQRLARGCAERGRVEPVVTQPTRCQALGRGRVAWSAERARGTEPDVVEQDDHDVRRALGRQQRVGWADRRYPGPSRRRSSARPEGDPGSAASCARDGRQAWHPFDWRGWRLTRAAGDQENHALAPQRHHARLAQQRRAGTWRTTCYLTLA